MFYVGFFFHHKNIFFFLLIIYFLFFSLFISFVSVIINYDIAVEVKTLLFVSDKFCVFDLSDRH